LIRPGSVTHHKDFDQRYIALEQVSGGPAGRVQFIVPPDSRTAPRGYCMMFIVSDSGIPSVAAWVQLQ